MAVGKDFWSVLQLVWALAETRIF